MFFLIASGLLVVAAIYGQRRYRGYGGFEEDNPAPMPADAGEKTEWAFARLRYPNFRGGYRWRRSSWATDYPKADRQFVQGVRRLTRLHTRSVEQVVNIEGDEIYDWPWIYAVEVGHWGLDEVGTAEARLAAGFCMMRPAPARVTCRARLRRRRRRRPGRARGSRVGPGAGA